MGVPPNDFSVTDGDHLPLNVRLSSEQLRHRSSVAVLADPSDSNLLSHHMISQIVPSSFGWHWLSSLPA